MYEAKHASRLIAKNTAIQIIGRILFLGLSLINFKLIAVYLGPTLFGDWGNVFNYTALFTVLADFGLFTVAVREIAKTPNKRQAIMENVLSLRLVLAIAASIAAFGLAAIIAVTAPQTGYAQILPAIGIGVLSMLIYFMSNMLDVVFHVELKMYFVAAVELIGKIMAVVVTGLAVWLDWGFMWVVGSVAIGNLAGMIARLIYAKRFFKVRLRFDVKMWGWLLRMAIPLGIVFTLNNIYFKIDSVMLYVMNGSFDTGIYTAAYRVLETTIFASAFFVQALTPYLSNYLNTKKMHTQAVKLIRVGTEVLYAMGGILAISLIFYAREVILLLSGPEYLAATVPLIMLAFAGACLYVNSLFGQVLVLLDRRRLLLSVSAATLAVNITLNLVLIPQFGFTGAAAATLLSEGMLLAGNFIIMRLNDLLTFSKRSMAIITAGLVIVIALYSTAHSWPIPWFVTFFAVPTLYILLLWRQRVIPLEVIMKR